MRAILVVFHPTVTISLTFRILSLCVTEYPVNHASRNSTQHPFEGRVGGGRWCTTKTSGNQRGSARSFSQIHLRQRANRDATEQSWSKFSSLPCKSDRNRSLARSVRKVGLIENCGWNFLKLVNLFYRRLLVSGSGPCVTSLDGV